MLKALLCHKRSGLQKALTEFRVFLHKNVPSTLRTAGSAVSLHDCVLTLCLVLTSVSVDSMTSIVVLREQGDVHAFLRD